MPHIFTICGSLRAGSFNSTLLAVAEAEITRLGGTFERYAKLRTLPHFDQDHEDLFPDEILELRDAVAAADGIFVATPAYNGALTGALKDWLDWLSRPLGQGKFTEKPLAVITASPGPNGGSQAADYLERIGKAFRAKLVYPITSIPTVHATLGETGIPNVEVTARVQETAQALMLTVRGAELVDNEAMGRFELVIDGAVTSYSNYRSRHIGDTPVIELPHTVTEPEHRGRGMAAFLTRGVLDRIAESETGTRVIPSCDFVADYIAAHPNYQPLLLG